MRRKGLVFGLALVLALAMVSAAWAQLLGEINPGNGFPTYVEDINGVQLDLPVPPLGDGVTAPTMIFDPVIPDNPWSVTTGFGAEAFFYLATSRIDLPAGGRAELVLAIEAAYGAGDPLNVPPDQFLFSRVRIRIDTPMAGEYIVTHPWGSKTFTNVPAGDRGINYTFDWGGLAPLCPSQVPCLTGPAGFERILISPTPWIFVSQFDPPPPVGWVGDGVTAATITPGVGGVDYFRIDGPTGSNLDGAGNDFIVTGLFTVSGHMVGGPPPPPPPTGQIDTVTITQARYTIRKQELDVRAISSLNLPMTAEWSTDGGSTTQTAPLTAGRLRITTAEPNPPTVTVTSADDPVNSNTGNSATAAVQIR